MRKILSNKTKRLILYSTYNDEIKDHFIRNYFEGKFEILLFCNYVHTMRRKKGYL